MFEDRSNIPTLKNAPISVTRSVAAYLEPAITVLTFLLATLFAGEPIERPELTLCFLVVALTWRPVSTRFDDNLAAAAVDILTSWVALVAILGLFGYATQSLQFFEETVLISWVIATPILQWLAAWIGGGVVRRAAARPSARRSAIVVGASALGVKVAKALTEPQDQGIDFIGYFDDRSDDRVHPETVSRHLGALKDVAAYVTEHGIRDVYITLPLVSQPRIVEVLEHLQDTTASLYFVPDVFGISIIQGRLMPLNGIPVLGICESPFTGTNELVKRISDIVLATIILILISPILLVVAIGVKLSSPGPVIFRQRRNGLDGDEIVVYKFRSMRTLDNGSVVPQATRDDPRITPFGAFLRRTSIDEFPQFINVLQGRMSIVGPRPHAVAHNKEYRQIIRAYMVRHKVKPGITGWAQVNGHRGETDTIEKMQVRVEYDLQYLHNWSLGLDLRIIGRTILLMFFDRKAF